MKKLLLSLLILASFSAFGQSGSMAVSGIKYRVNDTTTYLTAVAPAHAQGYADIFFNNQATTPHWDIWNGSSYDHVFDFNSGGGGSGEFVYDIEVISGTTHTVNDAALGALNKWFIYTNASGCTVTISDDVTIGKSFTGQRGPSAGTVTFDDNGTSVLITSSGDFDLEAVNRIASWTKQTSTDWHGVGELGAASTYTAGNGLTLTGSEFKVGGAATENTTFTGNFNWTWGSSGSRIGNFRIWSGGTTGLDASTSSFLQSGGNSVATSTASGIDINGDSIRLETAGSQLRLNADGSLSIDGDVGTTGQVITSNGSGPMTWETPSGGSLTVGTTAIASGTTTRVLYNNAGVLGEYPVTGSTNVVLSNSPTLVTPNLGTPSTLVLTNATGLPLNQNKVLIGNSSNVATSYSASYLTPEQYGAVGDDITNDAAAFASLITAASSLGVPIFIPGKTYLISSTLTIPSNLRIMGSGNASVLHTTSNIPILTFTSASNITVTDLVLKGSGTGASQRGVYANGNVGFTQLSLQNIISRCGFVNFGGDGIYVNFVIGSSAGGNHEGTYQISDSWFTGCATGIKFDTRGEYNNVSNCKFYLNTTAVNIIGGNNNIVGGNITDNTNGLVIGAGTNDGHCMVSAVKINHNTTNVSCASTATGYAIANCAIIGGAISLNACNDIRFYHCEISSSPITSTSSVGTIFLGNCFRTTPTITVAAGNTPVFLNNTFPAASTVHSLIVNTMQGGISQTQQGPTSPNTFTSTWTSTASSQFAHKFNGTLTPRATASDILTGVSIDIGVTGTANNQNYYDLDINPTATLATGGFTGTEFGALRTRGKIRFRGTATSGAVTSTSGMSYEDSGGNLIWQMSDDGIERFGGNGGPSNRTPTSNGTSVDKNGNGVIYNTGISGSNFSASNTGAGSSGMHVVRIGGSQLTTSGTQQFIGLLGDYTINQVGGTGDSYFLKHTPTLTAVGGTAYFIGDNTALNSGFGTLTPTAKLHVVGTTKLEGQTSISTGVTNATGWQHERITTGSIGAGSTALVTITWDVAFADTNYTAFADVEDATTSSLALSVVHIESKSTTNMTVRVINNAAGSLTGTLNAMAIHD